MTEPVENEAVEQTPAEPEGGGSMGDSGEHTDADEATAETE